MGVPSEHWSRIRTNNMFERVSLKLKCRTRTIDGFPDSQSALTMVCARLDIWFVLKEGLNAVQIWVTFGRLTQNRTNRPSASRRTTEWQK